MSNTEDLYKWTTAVNNYQLLSKETLDKALQPYKLTDGKLSEYGYGWFIRDLAGSRTIEHGGSIFGFRSEEIYLPNEKIFITGLFNCRQLNNDEQLLCYDIARAMLGKPLQKDITLSDEIQNRYVGIYKNDQYNVKLTIHKGPNNKLYGDLSNGSGVNMVLLAESETLFVLPQVKRIHTTLEFVVENGKAVKIIFSQENKGEFRRIE